MMPLGMQGFDSQQAAIDDARKAVSVADEMEFAVLRKGDAYAWCMPVHYAERIAESNGLEIVAVEMLHPPGTD